MESKTSTHRRPVNNAVYSLLGDRWYDADDDPIALLRAQARLRNPWIASQLTAHLGPGPKQLLDLGCGAGFLANALAERGHLVQGIDASRESLTVARAHDPTGSVVYREGDACALPYADQSFDAVCAMDFLEHVVEPAAVVAEASRVLRPHGLFFFHTFNRNWLSWLIVIKGVEWFVRNTPRDMHVLSLFLKPSEIAAMCADSGLDCLTFVGSRPAFDRDFLRMLTTRTVPPTFRFVWTGSTRLGFSGLARKRAPALRA